MSYEHCPICGRHKKDSSLVAARGITDQHRCSEKTLRGIDASRSVEWQKPREPQYGERLTFGFGLTSLE